MNAVSEISQQEIGRRVTQVREAAGIKQAELARKITWSPAVLSRVESGERPLAAEELKTVMEAIGTTEALQLSKALARGGAKSLGHHSIMPIKICSGKPS